MYSPQVISSGLAHCLSNPQTPLLQSHRLIDRLSKVFFGGFTFNYHGLPPIILVPSFSDPAYPERQVYVRCG